MLIIRVNMTDQTYKMEDVPKAYKYLAGRAMTSTLVADEVPPLCHPLGPNNKLIFSPGIVTGTPAPTSARVSVGAKSPLTGGIKEANAGSSWGEDLADMQIKALVLEGQPKKKGKYCGLHIAWDKGVGKPKIEFFRNSTVYQLHYFRQVSTILNISFKVIMIIQNREDKIIQIIFSFNYVKFI